MFTAFASDQQHKLIIDLTKRRTAQGHMVFKSRAGVYSGELRRVVAARSSLAANDSAGELRRGGSQVCIVRMNCATLLSSLCALLYELSSICQMTFNDCLRCYYGRMKPPSMRLRGQRSSKCRFNVFRGHSWLQTWQVGNVSGRQVCKTEKV